MRAHYDFSKMKGRKNPYLKMLQQPVTLRLDRDTVAWFKAQEQKTGLTWKQLISLYLRDCAERKCELKLNWANQAARK